MLEVPFDTLCSQLYYRGDASGAVTTCLDRSSTFIVSLVGWRVFRRLWSAWTPSRTFERVPPVFVELTEVLDQSKSLWSSLSSDLL